MSQGAGFGSQDSSRTTLKAIRTIVISQIAQAEISGDDGPIMLDSHPIESFVTCGVLKEYSDSPRKVAIWDSTGSADLRVPTNRELPQEIDDYIGQYVNVYGQFRTFNGKKTIDCTRVELNLKPYQFLYHEILAAREWYHYTDILPLDEKRLAESAEGDTKNKEDGDLFVGDNDPNWDLKKRITDIVRGADENDDEASAEYIARELCLDELKIQPMLLKLANEGTIYEVGGNFRISELS